MGYRQFRNYQRCLCDTEQDKNEITKICSKPHDCQIRLWFYIVHNNSDITGHNTKTMILSLLNIVLIILLLIICFDCLNTAYLRVIRAFIKTVKY